MPDSPSDAIVFESHLDTRTLPYLYDYQRVQGVLALPVSAFLEMALAAARAAFGPGAYALAGVNFRQVLFLTEEGARTVQVSLSPASDGEATFGISSLQLGVGRSSQWVLHAEGRVVRASEHAPPKRFAARPGGVEAGAQFSLFYFGSSEAEFARDRYELVLEGAKFADRHGLTAVWTPERHFHQFGGSYPTPAILSAALATITERVKLRAGSVVLPLHHPLRVAEEWSVVDNLSKGRVGVSFATGWSADDFVLAPDNYANRKEVLFEGLQVLKRFWRGETVHLHGGGGKMSPIKLFPLPMQPELPTWLTIVKNPEMYAKAGELGSNVLTNLLGQTADELAANIKIYRDSLARHGYDPEAGQVTLLLHTFIGGELNRVRETVRAPFSNYLKTTVGVISNLVKGLDLKLDIDKLTPRDMDDLLSFAFERYFRTGSLLGTPDTCQQMVERLRDMGVNEFACFIDFGVDSRSVLGSLEHLNVLRERFDGGPGGAKGTPGALDAVAAVRARCGEEMSGDELYAWMGGAGVHLGPSFRGVSRLWRGAGEALGRLRLPPSLEPEAGAYMVHPALLDAAFQLLFAVLPGDVTDGAGPKYVPAALGEMTVRGGLSPEMWGHVVLRAAEPGADSYTGDVRLLDEEGRTVVEVLGLRLQRLERASGQPDEASLGDVLYEVRWEPQERPRRAASDIASASEAPGTWFVFSDRAGAGRTLAALLSGRGERCLLVTPGERYEAVGPGDYRIDPARAEDFRRLLADVLASDQPPCRGVVHLWGLDAVPPEETTLDALESAQVFGCHAVTYLIQALAKFGLPEPPRLWLVTRGTQPASDGPEPISVTQSPLWGLGRVIGLEHPEFRCRTIDLDPSGPADDAGSLFEELLLDTDEDRVAFRGGERRVARLVRRAPDDFPARHFTRAEVDRSVSPAEESALTSPSSDSATQAATPGPIRSDGSYLITGGFGVLGMLLAPWMVKQGARHLVLVGRGSASHEARETLNVLRETGAEIVEVAADVTREADVARLLDEVRRSMPPLRGVIHAAMVIEDGVLLQMDRERFDAALRPKVQGAWNLHTQTLGAPLDFFVLFSSAASLFGSAGQGNYVAANAFLDALAHQRRFLNLPALTIDWGQWAEVHLKSRPGLTERLALLGMNPLPPEQGLEALGRLLGRECTQAGVMSVNWAQIFNSVPTIPPLLSHLSQEGLNRGAGVETQRAGDGRFREDLLALDEAERQQWLESHLRDTVARVLRYEPSQIDVLQPLNTLGLDSLMAIQVKTAMEASLGVTLPLVRLLEGPNIVQLAEVILEELTAQDSGPDGERVAEMLRMVEQLTDEEARAMLDRERLPAAGRTDHG